MPEEKSIIVLASLEVKDACEFKKRALEVARLSREEAGCLRYELFCDSENDRRFTFIEEYADTSAFEQHRKMPYMDAFREIRSRLVEKYLGVEELKRINRR